MLLPCQWLQMADWISTVWTMFWKKNSKSFKKNGLLEYIPHEPSMKDVGGLENIKRWLNRRNNSWMDSAGEYGLPAPKGILLTGIPGCGKSLIAKAVSSLWSSRS